MSAANWRRSSLSPGERGGACPAIASARRRMRGNRTRDQKVLRMYPNLIAAALVGIWCCLSWTSSAALPPASRLLPEDTLGMVTAPDFQKLWGLYKASPQGQ